jgi:hypothetical protein
VRTPALAGYRGRVRYINVERTRDGYLIDPSAYLDQLGRLAESLPPGASAFATDAQHYDFNALRFIKNLQPQRLVAGETDGAAWWELQLRHNCWRHEEDLTIRYHGVRSLAPEPAGRTTIDVTGLHEVFLDEVLPHQHGCSHEIVCLGGSLVVVCEDLTATWAQADCPERQPNP